MNYRTNAVVLIVVAGSCIQTAHASAQAGQPQKDEPRRFEGIENPTITLPDGRTVPLFVSAAPESGLDSPANVRQDEILASVAAEGADLRRGIDIGKIVMCSKLLFSFKVNGQEADHILLVTLHPQKRSVPGKIFKKPVTFTPGQVTRLAELLKTFGQPTETQLWSSKSTKDLGLDGSVSWWGEVGVSESSDAAITHILLRQIVKRD